MLRLRLARLERQDAMFRCYSKDVSHRHSLSGQELVDKS